MKMKKGISKVNSVVSGFGSIARKGKSKHTESLYETRKADCDEIAQTPIKGYKGHKGK